MHYYKRHLGDYAKDTKHLSLSEHGAFAVLLDYYYSTEKPIPDDRCERIANACTDEERLAVRNVLQEFFRLTPDGWVNDRADKEIGSASAKSLKAKESAAARWNANAYANALPTQSEGNAIHKPLSTTKAKHSCASSGEDAPTRNDPIPYQAIVDAYNRTMDRLSKARDLTAKRRTRMRTAWTGRRKSVEFWEAYFAECQRDPFLSGEGPYKNGHENWRPDFDYLIREDVVVRTYERAISRMEQDNG